MKLQRNSSLESAGVESEKELCRRLPEVNSLEGSIRDEVVDAFLDGVPDYFWIARASSSHHPRDEQGLGGLWLHTKRVFTAYSLLEPTYDALQVVDDYTSNCCRASILLHDAFKYGIDIGNDTESEDFHSYANGVLSNLPEYTDTSHDVLMASYIREETELPDEVARCVEAHGGSESWFSHDGRSPANDMEMLVHTADIIASNDEFGLPVYDPSTELELMVGGEIDAVSDDFHGW